MDVYFSTCFFFFIRVYVFAYACTCVARVYWMYVIGVLFVYFCLRDCEGVISVFTSICTFINVSDLMRSIYNDRIICVLGEAESILLPSRPGQLAVNFKFGISATSMQRGFG